MILSSLVELANREGLLANPDYEPKPVAWIIVVGEGGKFVNVIPTAGEGSGKKAKPKDFPIPRRVGRTSGACADFLVDKSEYVLGVEPDGKRSEADLRKRLDLFGRSTREALQATGSEAVASVCAFLENGQERAKAIERVTAQGYRSNDLFAFEFDGAFVHDLPAVRAYFSKTRQPAEDAEKQRQCLVCGARAAPVDKHPTVQMRGGTSSGISLVSFNSDAFESYGLERNENAPVCRGCAEGYTTALKRLLDERYPRPQTGEPMPKRHYVIPPNTTAVFWADQDSPLLNFISNFFDQQRAEDVEGLLRSPIRGWSSAPIKEPERFYCLILSGAQGRAIMRGMHTDTVAQVQENLKRYFDSIQIGSDQPLPFWLLLRSLVLQGKLENLPPGLATEVFLAIVFGGLFPRTLLARAVERCRAEQKVSRERAAVLRAYLIRNERNKRLEDRVGLDKENPSAGYRLGRLLAVLERVQKAAQNNPNKTIVDRYYGAASTRPATVFPRLIGLSQHHLAKLTGGLESFFRLQQAEIIESLSTFPATLNLQEQGLFALGYYHQYQDFFKKQADKSEAGGGEAAEGAAA